ncbi:MULTISPECIES: hypothetical protein [Pseudoalteromonas]|uniref:hypothetical protein n=1 Tax=Pseudoalteromonas TaxID=53246 RepID=UPI00147DDDB0|nr:MULTISPECIES: hypothetical protein [Pseudoalteromonas]
MKTSITLKIKAKKLKELSQVQAQQVAAAGTGDTTEPKQAQKRDCETQYTYSC